MSPPRSSKHLQARVHPGAPSHTNLYPFYWTDTVLTLGLAVAQHTGDGFSENPNLPSASSAVLGQVQSMTGSMSCWQDPG